MVSPASMGRSEKVFEHLGLQKLLEDHKKNQTTSNQEILRLIDTVDNERDLERIDKTTLKSLFSAKAIKDKVNKRLMELKDIDRKIHLAIVNAKW